MFSITGKITHPVVVGSTSYHRKFPLMNTFPMLRSLLLGAALSLLLVAPALAAEVKPAPNAKPAAKAAAKPKAKATSKKAASKSTTTNSADLQARLDEFARNTVASMNRCVLPSCDKKEVRQNADGTFTARYIEIDPKSIETSYKKPENSKIVNYIGYMNYAEIEYVCTAGTKNAALAGPFTPARREHMTELVKYMKGKWTY